MKLNLDREEWGVIVDALIQHKDHSDNRKSGNSESTSDQRSDMCTNLIKKINFAAMEGIREGSMTKINRDITYYISGPMYGYPEKNFPVFEEAKRQLGSAGISVVSPHDLELPYETENWRDYLSNDIIVMLQECGGIILLKGWPQSRGARMELDVALGLGWPVYYYEDWMLTDMNKAE